MSIDQLIDKSPPYFMIDFHFQGICTDSYKTCWSVTDHLNIPTFWNQKYGHVSIRVSNIYPWNSMQNLLINISLLNILAIEKY